MEEHAAAPRLVSLSSSTAARAKHDWSSVNSQVIERVSSTALENFHCMLYLFQYLAIHTLSLKTCTPTTAVYAAMVVHREPPAATRLPPLDALSSAPIQSEGFGSFA